MVLLYSPMQLTSIFNETFAVAAEIEWTVQSVVYPGRFLTRFSNNKIFHTTVESRWRLEVGAYPNTLYIRSATEPEYYLSQTDSELVTKQFENNAYFGKASSFYVDEVKGSDAVIISPYNKKDTHLTSRKLDVANILLSDLETTNPRIHWRVTHVEGVSKLRKCQYGWYSTNSTRENRYCVRCPLGQTTVARGATAKTSCVGKENRKIYSCPHVFKFLSF